jgi:hypothetical protein
MAVLLLAGCMAGKAGTGIGKAAPGAEYLTAEGIGRSESEARNQARAELSRIFESRVYSDTFDRVTAVIDSPGVETSRQQIESKVRVVSRVELKGVEIDRAWKEDGEYHALAKLDRYKARDNWLREMKDIDGRIEGRLDALDSLESRLLRFRSLNAVSDLWIGREVLVSRLRVLGFDYSGFPGYDMKSVFQRTVSIKSGMPVYLDIKGEHGARVREEVSEALGRAGYIMTERRDGASVTVTGRVEIWPVDVENPELEYARAIVALEIADAEAGLLVGEVSENRRAAHLSRPEAVERALKKVMSAVSGKLVRYIEREEAD